MTTTSYQAVLENILDEPLVADGQFSYKAWYEIYKMRHPRKVSEKGIATAVGVSERQIRNARITGYMPEGLADKLCVRLLSLLPYELYGDEWFENVKYDDGFDEWYEDWVKNGSPPVATAETFAHNPETTEGMTERYLSGMTLKQTGAAAGLSHTTVRTRLVNAGVELRPRGPRSK